MGWTPVDFMTLRRDYNKREIVITWTDAVLGEKEKRFPFDEKDKALEFAAKEFNQLCM